MISNILRKIDLFGHKHVIYYNGAATEKTAVGGISTIFVAITVLFAFIFFGREVFERNTPITVKSEQLQTDGVVQATALRFHFIITDMNGMIFEEDSPVMQALIFTAVRVRIEPVESQTRTIMDNIPVVSCAQMSGMEEIAQLHNSQMSPEKGRCLQIPEEMEIKNEFGAIGSSSVLFQVRVCNAQMYPGCDTALRSLEQFQILTYSVDGFFNPESFSEPVGSRLIIKSTNLTTQLTIRRNLVFMENETDIDNGIIFVHSDKTRFFSNTSSEVQTELKSDSSNTIFDLRLEATKLKATFKRRYTKLQELLAFIGGFTKGILLVGSTVSRLYAKYFFFREQFSIPVEENRSVISIRSADSTRMRAVPPGDKPVPACELSLRQFLIGLFSTKYLTKRGFDYSTIHNKFDVYCLNNQIKEIKAKLTKLVPS